MKPGVETMMHKILKQSGYVTAMIGKWGQLPLGPTDFGFDEEFRFTGSGLYWNTQARKTTYTVNGKTKPLGDKEYMPDLMHNYLIDFVTRNRDKPFYAYYSMSHIHVDILPAPDSAPGASASSKSNYSDNISYMDKLVGKLVAELDRLKLRENTLIVFVGDNGTGSGYAAKATIQGRRLSGEKGSMLEAGSLVPLIVNWPGKTPAGKISHDLVDSTDFVPTFAELCGAKLPENNIMDGQSFALQIRNQNGKPRNWIFIQLARKWYVRDAKWKLNQAGELFDMTKAPFEEPMIAADTKDPAALAARKRLQDVLDKLNPAGGILDDGDGTGRHKGREEKKKNKQ